MTLSPQRSVSLLPYNTFGIDVKADTLFSITNEQDLKEFFFIHPDTDFLVLGGGSNVLFTQSVQCPLLKMNIGGVQVLEEDEEQALVEAGAGEIWHELVLYALDKGFPGFENLSLIPGTVGAAPIQNIGAYGVEVCTLIDKVRYFDVQEGVFKEIENKDCQFGYRDSIFKKALKGRAIITKVYFRVDKRRALNLSYGSIKDELAVPVEEAGIRDVSDAVIRIRQSKLPDPRQIGNGGSFFKNPVISQMLFDKIRAQYPGVPHFIQEDGIKVPAAWLIETCGWKGYRRENYGVHQRQALVLVNYGGAKGKDILELSEEIIRSVFEKFGIRLEREVQIF